MTYNYGVARNWEQKETLHRVLPNGVSGIHASSADRDESSDSSLLTSNQSTWLTRITHPLSVSLSLQLSFIHRPKLIELHVSSYAHGKDNSHGDALAAGRGVNQIVDDMKE